MTVMALSLTLKAPTTTAGEDILRYFYYYFSEEVKLDIHVSDA